MNRRTFFQRTIGALAAATLAPYLPKVITTFKGAPVLPAAWYPNNTLYFTSVLKEVYEPGIAAAINTESPLRAFFK